MRDTHDRPPRSRPRSVHWFRSPRHSPRRRRGARRGTARGFLDGRGRRIPVLGVRRSAAGAARRVYSSLDGLTADQKNALVLGEVFTRIDGPGRPSRRCSRRCAEWRPHVVLRRDVRVCRLSRRGAAGPSARPRRHRARQQRGLHVGHRDRRARRHCAPRWACPVDPSGERLSRRAVLHADAAGEWRIRRPRARRQRSGSASRTRVARTDCRTGGPATSGRSSTSPSARSRPTMDLFPALYRAAIDAARRPRRCGCS